MDFSQAHQELGILDAKSSSVEKIGKFGRFSGTPGFEISQGDVHLTDI